MVVGHECMHNFSVMARSLLNGDLRFGTMCNLNGLGVAKIARLTTSARSSCRQAFSGMSRSVPYGRKNNQLQTNDAVSICSSRWTSSTAGLRHCIGNAHVSHQLPKPSADHIASLNQAVGWMIRPNPEHPIARAI